MTNQIIVYWKFQHAWSAYGMSLRRVCERSLGLTRPERDAMGCDSYNPVSRVGSNLTNAGGIGYMIIDAIDSMILLGLDEEYQRAREWVANELSFDRDGDFSTFEVSPPPKDESFLEVSVTHRHLIRRPFEYWADCCPCMSCPDAIRYTWRKQSTWRTGLYPPSKRIPESRCLL